MFSKRSLSTITIAAVAATLSLSTSLSAGAGGYGYGNSNSGSYSYQQVRPRAHKRQAYSGSNKHLRWCYSQFRSYRQFDNTFQPYGGPRKECLSPYTADRLKLFADYNNAPEALSRGQAATLDVTQRDQFGNLPEGASADSGVFERPETPRDQFGNLPEQFSFESAPNSATGQGQALTDAVAPTTAGIQASTSELEPETTGNAAASSRIVETPNTSAEPAQEAAPPETASAERDPGGALEDGDEAAGEDAAATEN